MPQATPTVRRKTGWKQFLTPGWVITAVLVVLFTYTAFTVLAPWQLGKNSRTQATNHRLEQAFHADAVDITSLLPTGTTTIAEDNEWKRVTITGTFDNSGTLILRNRPVNSQPAYQILTPITLDDGRSIVINRGYVTPVNGAALPAIPSAPSGRTTIEAFLRLDESAPADTTTGFADGYRQITSINTAWIAKEDPEVQLITGYAQSVDAIPSSSAPSGSETDGSSASAGTSATAGSSASSGTSGAAGGSATATTITAIPLPQLSSGPYLSYGIQWIAFGILAPIGLGYFVFAEIRERRRARAEDALAALEEEASSMSPAERADGSTDPDTLTANPEAARTGLQESSTSTEFEATRPRKDAGSSAPTGADTPEDVPLSATANAGNGSATSVPQPEHNDSSTTGAPKPRRRTDLADRYGSSRGGRRAFSKRATREEERF